MKNELTITDLPAEMHSYMNQFLTVGDLAKFRATSNQIREINENNFDGQITVKNQFELRNVITDLEKSAQLDKVRFILIVRYELGEITDLSKLSKLDTLEIKERAYFHIKMLPDNLKKLHIGSIFNNLDLSETSIEELKIHNSQNINFQKLPSSLKKLYFGDSTETFPNLNSVFLGAEEPKKSLDDLEIGVLGYFNVNDLNEKLPKNLKTLYLNPKSYDAFDIFEFKNFDFRNFEFKKINLKGIQNIYQVDTYLPSQAIQIRNEEELNDFSLKMAKLPENIKKIHIITLSLEIDNADFANKIVNVLSAMPNLKVESLFINAPDSPYLECFKDFTEYEVIALYLEKYSADIMQIIPEKSALYLYVYNYNGLSKIDLRNKNVKTLDVTVTSGNLDNVLAYLPKKINRLIIDGKITEFPDLSNVEIDDLEIKNVGYFPDDFYAKIPKNLKEVKINNIDFNTNFPNFLNEAGRWTIINGLFDEIESEIIADHQSFIIMGNFNESHNLADKFPQNIDKLFLLQGDLPNMSGVSVNHLYIDDKIDMSKFVDLMPKNLQSLEFQGSSFPDLSSTGIESVIITGDIINGEDLATKLPETIKFLNFKNAKVDPQDLLKIKNLKDIKITGAKNIYHESYVRLDDISYEDFPDLSDSKLVSLNLHGCKEAIKCLTKYKLPKSFKELILEHAAISENEFIESSTQIDWNAINVIGEDTPFEMPSETQYFYIDQYDQMPNLYGNDDITELSLHIDHIKNLDYKIPRSVRKINFDVQGAETTYNHIIELFKVKGITLGNIIVTGISNLKRDSTIKFNYLGIDQIVEYNSYINLLGRNVKHLDFSNSIITTMDLAKFIDTVRPKSINLTKSNITVLDLANILNYELTIEDVKHIRFIGVSNIFKETHIVATHFSLHNFPNLSNFGHIESIDFSGAKMIAAYMLSNNLPKNLKAIDLTGTSITMFGLLEIQGVNWSEVRIRGISNLFKKEEISFGSSEDSIRGRLPNFARLTKLKKLSIFWGVTELGNLPSSLETLVICADLKVFPDLSKMENLKELNLYGSNTIQPHQLSFKLPKGLEKICFVGTKINYQNYQSIGGIDWSKVEVTDNRKIEYTETTTLHNGKLPYRVPNIRNETKLRNLIIKENVLSIGNLPFYLKTLKITSKTFNNFPDLSKMPCLEEIDLTGCENISAKDLSGKLPENLKFLFLKGTKIHEIDLLKIEGIDLKNVMIVGIDNIFKTRNLYLDHSDDNTEIPDLLDTSLRSLTVPIHISFKNRLPKELEYLEVLSQDFLPGDKERNSKIKLLEKRLSEALLKQDHIDWSKVKIVGIPNPYTNIKVEYKFTNKAIKEVGKAVLFSSFIFIAIASLKNKDSEKNDTFGNAITFGMSYLLAKSAIVYAKKIPIVGKLISSVFGSNNNNTTNVDPSYPEGAKAIVEQEANYQSDKPMAKFRSMVDPREAVYCLKK